MKGGSDVSKAVVKGAQKALNAGNRQVAVRAAAGAAGGGISAATAESGLQPNQAISGEGFDIGKVVEAGATGAVVGGAIGAVEGGVLKGVQQSIDNVGSNARVTGPSTKLEGIKESASIYVENATDGARDQCQEAGKC